MSLRRLRFFLLLYAAFDFFIGGNCAGFLPLTPLAAAQFTTVTGTIIDPNGLPYSFGSINAVLVVPGGTSPTLSGLAYTPPTQPARLDITGSFLMNVADNTQLLPGGTKWNFTVCSETGATVQPAFGKGSVCFTLAVPITISGASQSISAQLQAAALPLTVPFSSVAGVCGSGTLNLVPVWTSPTCIGNSSITDNGIVSTTERIQNQYTITSVISPPVGRGISETLTYTGSGNVNSPLASYWAVMNPQPNSAGAVTLTETDGEVILSFNNGNAGAGSTTVTTQNGLNVQATGGTSGSGAVTNQNGIKVIANNTSSGIVIPVTTNHGVDVQSGPGINESANQTVTNDSTYYVQPLAAACCNATSPANHAGIEIADQGAQNQSTTPWYGLLIDQQSLGPGFNTLTRYLGMKGRTSGNVVGVSPAASTGAWDFTWPTSAGSAGNFLQTDGAGNASWAAGGAIAYSRTTNTAVAVGAANTVVITKAITFPAAGCPCRARISYGIFYTATASGVVSFWASDGTNFWAQSQVLTNTAGGGNNSASGNATEVSPVTYANNANITFTVNANTNSSGGITTGSSSLGQTSASYLTIEIISSN